MDMSSLFPNEDALATAMASARPHVSFKAGRMSYDMTTRMVTADPRKGVFQIVTSPEDSLTHLQWRARPGAEVEPQHDLIVFPGDTVMSPVQSTSARVFVLKWIDADTRMFFYMQGGDESADASAITQVNRILNSGPSHQRAPAPTQPPVPPSRLRIPDGSPDAQPSEDAAPLTFDSLSRMLDQSVASARERREAPSVGQVLRAPPIDSAVRAASPRDLASVLETLPQDDRSPAAAADLLRSASVQAQAAALSRALAAPDAADVLRQLGLPADSSTTGLPALLEAIRRAAERRDN